MDLNIDTINYDHLNSTISDSSQQNLYVSSVPSISQFFNNLYYLFPSLPYSAKYIIQDQVPNFERAITKTETQRLLGLHGEDGMFACRITDGWATVPQINKNGRITLASRSILRLNNITIFRGDPTDTFDYKLKYSMIGPNHYFGVLDKTNEYCCTIQYNNNGIPVFVKEKTNVEQSLATYKIPDHYIKTIDSVNWLSGKDYRYNKLFNESDTKLVNKQSLTKDLGKLIFEIQDTELELPKFDALQFDLSPFGAKLVKNNKPFKITASAEDPMDVVTYHFGEEYSTKIVEKGMGLFLETHDFTQIMSPVTQDSRGFICLGKWQGKKLQLIAVEVPYGYSIIISKGAIHGDSTFIGSYLMAMTVNHNTMATADVVFLKNINGENLMLKQERKNLENSYSPELSLEKISEISFNNTTLKPLVIVPGGNLKTIFDADIKHQKKPLDQAVYTGSSVIYNPFNSVAKKIQSM